MEQNQTVKKFDGSDEVVFSGAFNVYDNELVIKDLLGFNFKFVFEASLLTLPPDTPQKDISAIGEGKDVTITLSAKIRKSAIGSGTTQKNQIIEFSNGKKLFWSMFVQPIGNDERALSVVVTFYLR